MSLNQLVNSENESKQDIYVNEVISDQITTGLINVSTLQFSTSNTDIINLSSLPGYGSAGQLMTAVGNGDVTWTNGGGGGGGVNYSGSLPANVGSISLINATDGSLITDSNVTETTVLDNETRSTTNQSNILTNTNNISTNTSNISINSSNISSNLTKINTNTSNISQNLAKINQNTIDINTNQNNIQNNSQAILLNSQAIQSNTSNIAQNSLLIAQNSNSIQNNSVSITANTQEIVQNRTDIDTNSINITNNQNAIQINADNILLKLNKSGDTMSGNLIMGNNSIFGVSSLNGFTPIGGVFSQINTTGPFTAPSTSVDLLGSLIGSPTIPANGFKQGDSFSLEMSGNFVSAGAGNDDITLEGFADGTLLFTSGLITITENTTTTWRLSVKFVIRNVGISSTVISTGFFTYDRAGTTYGGSFSDSQTIDTTTTQSLSIKYTTPNLNSFDCSQAILTKIF